MGEYKQTSFSGGFNLLLDDSRLPVSVKYKEGDSPYDISYNQYRLGNNIRTRFDVGQSVPSSIEDTAAPVGIKQAILTFGNYIILFVSGQAWYRLNTSTGWTRILKFSMSQTTPRYWTKEVPLSTTNYGRLATANSNTPTVPQANLPIAQINQIAGTFGTLPGLLVQDGINQPQFIYLDQNNNIQCRTTQTYNEWVYDSTGVNDKREYVPVGTFMEWYNGVLFIVSPDFNIIYRSVSGRPLDFVINVDLNGNKGGNATTTAYSVGVGGITALRTMPGNSLFVAAGGATAYSLTFNQTPNAPTLFGEYTFNRQVLFSSNCLTERGIVDIPGPANSPNSGDSVFIDANGLRSFNAIQQQQNEGRNSVFSATVQGLFKSLINSTTINKSIGSGWVAATVFDNYAIFSANTIYGNTLIIYDTINGVYEAIDTQQLGNHAVKQFASITVATLALYAITDDDKVYQLYASTTKFDDALIRLGAVCTQDPKKEIKVISVRAILSNITKDCSITCTLFVNNRLDTSVTTNIKYVPPVKVYTGTPIGDDVGTQTTSILFTFPNAAQGWKTFAVLTWTAGATLTSTLVTTEDLLPLQPLQAQAVVNQI